MDLIDREALINAVEDLYEYAELGEALDVIKAAPTVEERPHGKWIIQDIVHCLQYCSECRTYSEFKWNFCPNCGADMREANDET